ncbi:uncharacterized protein SCHCODRAFT_02636589 [Schizophyllum commune H4-8]|uniref:Expressed protein n=1 Tax=Schizophyllum commune (strain H4-8 / FGSC 9210) TaxID=578458 RepID=D8QEA4_SCHCM|nr:uncharacterized protein SCHCODRAFT_02636589 [Schizophyllum commune H4-8]KAI5888381.1 hypothetical protein SCHCODRAFT_02636589 [Schizophyllum commune H4-8]
MTALTGQRIPPSVCAPVVQFRAPTVQLCAPTACDNYCIFSLVLAGVLREPALHHDLFTPSCDFS